MDDTSVRRVESFETRVRPIGEADVGKLHELTVGVGWPHREEDLRLLLACGEGLLACDPIDRAIGSAMWFPSGDGFATIGMVVITPHLQDLGAGRWLMDHVLPLCAGRDLALVATPEAYRLYHSIGFEPVGVVAQHQGIARSATCDTRPPANAVLRAAGPDDFERILAADAEAFGVERQRILTHLFEASEVTLMEVDGALRGFVFERAFGRGRLFGPMAATSEDIALALTADRIARRIGEFVRLDLPLGVDNAIDAATPDAFARAFLSAGRSSRLSDVLTDCGLERQDRNTLMRLGGETPEDRRWTRFALAAQAIG
jgi:GNAT superfamily N-acetyltransferase